MSIGSARTETTVAVRAAGILAAGFVTGLIATVQAIGNGSLLAQGGLSQHLPALIGTALVSSGIMAVATLAHALFSATRRRRRELAILKVLGFRRRQVSATIAWQATVVAVLAIMIGVPLGIALGRWGWQAFARRLGVPDTPVTPLPAIAAVAVLAIVVAIVTALIPARLAGRTRPGVALRAE